MFAIIKTGGKQYRVENGSVVKIEKSGGTLDNVGDQISFSHVLMIGDGEKVEIGNPTLSGHTVVGTVVEQGRYRKVGILKMRRRKHYMKRGGHRQHYTAVKIDQISLD